MYLFQFALVCALASAAASCAVRSAGIGQCVAPEQCASPSTAFGNICPDSSSVCCVRTHDPARRQSDFYQARCASSGAESFTCAYLDDIYCQKTFPSRADSTWRDFQCPNRYDEAHLQGFSADVLPSSRIVVNTTALRPPLVETDFLHMSLILIRRDIQGRPHYR